GVKEETAQPKAAKLPGKAGWVKKSSGKILGTYKDRYIHLDKTVILVYENEELQNVIEKVELENYDKCHELRSPFKKNRLVLIRAPKSKVHDVKFQAQSPEEREAWIKALSDGINRAKNKVFDEIKVDESCSLEHVTRTRPKGNQGRRPPTRVHMKEVANVSSDGNLRLDLDAVDNTPNGNHPVFTDIDDTKEAVKPPMPPCKPSGTLQETSNGEPSPEKKVLKPPMPPSKVNKPTVQAEEAESNETPAADGTAELVAPPTPPTKPNNTSEDTANKPTPPAPSPPSKELKPPMPPSKDKKPSATAKEEYIEVSPEAKEKDEKSPEGEEQPKASMPSEKSDETVDKHIAPPSPPSKDLKPPDIKPVSPATEPEESAEAPATQEVPSPTEPQEQPSPIPTQVETKDSPAPELSTEMPSPEPIEPSPEPLKKSPGPPALKKKPLIPPVKEKVQDQPQDVDILPERKEDVPCEENVSAFQQSVPEAQTPPEPNQDVPLPDISAEQREHEGDKLSDSAQNSHSEDESEVDNIRASTTALSGSRANLDIDIDDGGVSDLLFQNKEEEKSKDRPPLQDTNSMALHCMKAVPPPVPLKSTSKGKFASMGDLLSEPTGPTVQRQEETIKTPDVNSTSNYMAKLHGKVTWELENTEKLLQKLSQDENETAKATQEATADGQSDLSAEEILNKAVEKLKKADEFLKEVQSLKE
ncbi:PKHO2 protein, partial [Amia calva]|nr:PKHO2 protein [Amia calva]